MLNHLQAPTSRELFLPCARGLESALGAAIGAASAAILKKAARKGAIYGVFSGAFSGVFAITFRSEFLSTCVSRTAYIAIDFFGSLAVGYCGLLVTNSYSSFEETLEIAGVYLGLSAASGLTLACCAFAAPALRPAVQPVAPVGAAPQMAVSEIDAGPLMLE